MKNLKLMSSTIVIEDELKDIIQGMPFDEQQKLIADNVEIITTSDGTEMLTLLLDVDNGNIISFKDASDEEKRILADKQYKAVKEHMNDKDFKKNLGKQVKIALDEQSKMIIESGNTPIVGLDKTIKVLPIPFMEFKTIKQSILNLMLSFIVLGIYSANPTENVRLAGMLTMIGNFVSLMMLAGCVPLILIDNKVKKDTNNE